MLTTYLGRSPENTATIVRYRFVATANQTAFTGNDADGKSLFFRGSCDVYINGSKLVSNGYTFTNTLVTLVTPVSVNTVVEIITYSEFSVQNSYTIQETNALLNSKLDTNNPVVIGSLTLPGNPAANNHATTRQYVDTQVSNILTENVSFSGNVTFNNNVNVLAPVANTNPATKIYVDNIISNIDVNGGGNNTPITSNTTFTASTQRSISVAMANETSVITLPSALSLSLGGPRYVITNTNARPFVIRNSAGALVTRVGSFGVAELYLRNNTTAAGQWTVEGLNCSSMNLTDIQLPLPMSDHAFRFPPIQLDTNRWVFFGCSSSTSFDLYAVVFNFSTRTFGTPVLIAASGYPRSSPRTGYSVISSSRIALTLGGNNLIYQLNISGDSITVATGSLPTGSYNISPPGMESNENYHSFGTTSPSDVSNRIIYPSPTFGSSNDIIILDSDQTSFLAVRCNGATPTVGTASPALWTENTFTGSTSTQGKRIFKISESEFYCIDAWGTGARLTVNPTTLQISLSPSTSAFTVGLPSYGSGGAIIARINSSSFIIVKRSTLNSYYYYFWNGSTFTRTERSVAVGSLSSLGTLFIRGMYISNSALNRVTIVTQQVSSPFDVFSGEYDVSTGNIVSVTNINNDSLLGYVANDATNDSSGGNNLREIYHFPSQQVALYFAGFATTNSNLDLGNNDTNETPLRTLTVLRTPEVLRRIKFRTENPRSHWSFVLSEAQNLLLIRSRRDPWFEIVKIDMQHPNFGYSLGQMNDDVDTSLTVVQNTNDFFTRQIRPIEFSSSVFGLLRSGVYNTSPGTTVNRSRIGFLEIAVS